MPNAPWLDPGVFSGVFCFCFPDNATGVMAGSG
jgi:hypothetical protein